MEFDLKFIEMTCDIHSTPTIRKMYMYYSDFWIYVGTHTILFVKLGEEKENKYTSRSVNWISIFFLMCLVYY